MTAQQRGYPSESSSAARYAGWILLLCALAGGCALLPASLRLVKAHADVTYPESAIAHNAQLTAQTGRIYPSISQPPYTPAVYGPAYYLGLESSAVAGQSIDDVLVAGRILSFGAFCLLIIGVWLLARRLGASHLSATLAASLVFADPEFFRTDVSARPDLIALALATWAILAALIDPDDWRPMAAAGMLASLAVLMKPSLVAASLALVIWLLRSRRWKSLAALAAGAAFAAFVCAGRLIMHGDPILGQTGLLTSGIDDPIGALGIMARETFHYWPHVLIAAGAAWFVRRSLRADSSPRSLAALYCIASWIIAALTLMNPGGNVNYLLEPWTISSVLFALVISELPPMEVKSRWAVIALCAVAGVGGVVHDNRVSGDRNVTDDSALASIAAHRNVLSDDPYISAHDARPELLDPFLISQLQAAGRWSDGQLREQLQQQQFDLVALTTYNEKLRAYRNHPFVSRALLSEILASYSPFCETPGQGPKRFERMVVLLPKRGIDERLADELERIGCAPSPDPEALHAAAQVAANGRP